MKPSRKTVSNKAAGKGRATSAAKAIGRHADKAEKRALARVAFPKHALLDCLRIPEGVLDQNAGGECTDKEAATFAKLGWGGDVGTEISSGIKYGFLERPSPGKVRPTELARKVLRPQSPADRITGLRTAILNAPVISDFYKRYRGENLPEEQFLVNTAVDSFGVPSERVPEFIKTFKTSLEQADLLEEVGAGKTRVLDVMSGISGESNSSEDQIRKLSKGLEVSESDTCFVMMPFAEPLGGYYASVYQPAIERAKLKPVRADADIYGTGKIIDQIWDGINRARVLVAELTGRNPNVLYELGIAHALEKPVVLVSSNEDDVPFDVRHVRVIYYDMRDPFWGTKLIEKVAENIVSALKNPKEATLFEKRP